MNCKNSAQNALKVAIFRLKIRGPSPNTTPLAPAALGHSILELSALDLGPPFANPASATGCAGDDD